ncbi:DJ-1/PfpI family protein [Dictyobacter arantiisoli]|nr:DJ-1/PfpI family protein [Dictyobacter arantiisoli]
MSENIKPTVGILLFDEVEVLDFCGPFEVFSVARRPGVHNDSAQLFNVVTIAETDRIISCRGGLLVKPQATIEQHPALDILVVPGGNGTRTERHNNKLIEWIQQQDRQTQLTTSVCTGAFLLAESALLDQRHATTHWNSVTWMKETYPRTTVLADARIVDEGHIITSAGISAGIDMSLYIVERLFGTETAQWTAKHMEYEWHARGQVVKY